MTLVVLRAQCGKPAKYSIISNVLLNHEYKKEYLCENHSEPFLSIRDKYNGSFIFPCEEQVL